MAKLKPTNTGKPVVGIGTKLDAVGLACDAVGMTDIPVVSQGAELISAGISLATGDYIGATMSVGSMIPIAGKVAEAAKVTHKSKRVVDGVSTAQKEAQLLTITAKEADDIADVAKQTKNVPVSSTKQVAPQPSKTQAKSVNKQPAKENQIVGGKFDIHEGGLRTSNIDKSRLGKPSASVQKQNSSQYSTQTNSNLQLNNIYKSVGSSLHNNIQSATSLFRLAK